MAFFLRIYRLIALPIVTLFYITLSIPFQFGGWRGRRKIAQLLCSWGRCACRIMGLRVRVTGYSGAFSGGLVVSNHLSWLDILAHASVVALRFTSTTAVAKWPFLGPIIMVTQPILVDRDYRPASRKALRDFAKTVKNGINLIVYPEGTSTDGKNGVLPFKSTSFAAVSARDIPVYPLVTRYREEPGRPTVCWYGDMTFVPHAWTMMGFAHIDVDLHFLPPVMSGSRTRKEMADHVHGMIDRAYRDMAGREKENALYSAR